MNQPLRILIVEDSAADARLVANTLTEAGYDVTWDRVEAADTMREALARAPWDAVLSDYAMPHFDAPSALAVLRSSGLDLPFIIVSGAVGEETAVAAMRNGAHDYVMKDRLTRLPAALARELKDAAVRRERHALEARLRDEDTRIRALVERAHEAVVLLDTGGRIAYTSPASERILGYPPGEQMGRFAFELIHPADVEETRAAFRSLCEQPGGALLREVRCVRKDGATCWLDLAATNQLHVPSIRGIVVNYRDVTERKRIEAELLRRNRELALINRIIVTTNTELEPFAILNTACRELALACEFPRVAILLRNEARTSATIVAEYCAAGRPSAIGAVITTTDDPLSRSIVEARECVVVEDARSDPRFAPVGRLIDQTGVVSVGIWPLIDHEETIGALILASDERHPFADIAALVANVAVEISGALVHSRLNETARRLLTAIEQVPESVVITDAEARILYVNPAFERTTGYTKTDVIGRNPNLLKSGRHDPGFYRQLWDTLTAGRVWHGRFVNKRKDGSLFTDDATIAPVHDPSGAITHYIATKRDVTRELQLEQQLYHSQRMEAFGQLAGGVAHDFNNILAVILMHLSLLQRDPELSPKVRSSIDELMCAAQRAAGVTRQLLVFSRRQAPEVQTIDLNRIVSGLVKMLRRLLGEDIELVLDAGDERLWIEADAGMMEQVLMNLGVNARDAMPEGGRLVIGTKRLEVTAGSTSENSPPGRYVCLTISDQGCGMDAQTLQHIFEPFFTTKPVGKGTGLGLATVYGIVQQHHGWIEVESVVGQGSTFRVFLPYSPQAGANTTPVLQSELPHGHERILLVEDDEFLRRTTALCLLECGYQVTEASNGPEAMRLWEEHNHEFDLLLTDVTMPGGISGNHLADRLRRAKESLKVVMVSGYNQELRESGRLPAGCVLLQKPVELLKLLRTVRDSLGAQAPSTQSMAN